MESDDHGVCEDCEVVDGEAGGVGWCCVKEIVIYVGGEIWKGTSSESGSGQPLAFWADVRLFLQCCTRVLLRQGFCDLWNMLRAITPTDTCSAQRGYLVRYCLLLTSKSLHNRVDPVVSFTWFNGVTTILPREMNTWGLPKRSLI